jgi:hypothetical protein
MSDLAKSNFGCLKLKTAKNFLSPWIDFLRNFKGASSSVMREPRGTVRAAGIIGAEVFTGEKLKGRVLLMNKAWAMKFKKYAVLAGVNEPKKSCHGGRKARAEVAAYADCTESQMMAMFGWTDPKMPAHYIAQANREKLGMTGMDKIFAFDQSQLLDDFTPLPEAHQRENA